MFGNFVLRLAVDLLSAGSDMADANPHVIAILNSEQYPAELRAKALELIAQTGLESERRRSEEDARREIWVSSARSSG